MTYWLSAYKKALPYVKTTLVMLSVCAFSTTALANPVLDNIASGNVTVQQTQSTTTVHQQSQKAILNWQSFNIGAGEHTHFQQPENGVALNRINPQQGVSEIYGQLTATGEIILVNPAGFHFGPSAYVNVGGLVASTANISNEDFLNDYYHFANDSNFNGFIHNQGRIIAADHGLVALVGGAVRNDGMIQANMGTALLASGDAFTMSLAGNNLVHFSVDEGVTGRAIDINGNEIADGVRNTGTIMANGGHILVSAKAAAGVLDHVINMEGIAEAQTVDTHSGELILMGNEDDGVVRVAGVLNAHGYDADERGGKVQITGHNILIDEAIIDVSGDAGGGSVNIGGNYLGEGQLPNANAVVMADASIYADAVNEAVGGRIIVWSDEYTYVSGQISATGGSQGGDGGFIETSSKNILTIGELEVDTKATYGSTGTWLLDPINVTISLSIDSNGSFAGGNPNIFTPSASGANILNTTLESNLSTANVIITTSGIGEPGHITVSAPITWLSANTLTLQADGNIYINNAISGVNGGLQLQAGTPSSTIQTNSLGNVQVANFDLLRGKWIQVGTLPTFSVTNNFQLNTGSLPDNNVEFIRALSGDGTLGDPYVLTDVYGLQGIGSNDTTLTYHYKLGNNIDASTTATWDSGAGFVPNGNGSDYFYGTFDGQNYAINDLTILRPSDSGIGLFSMLDAGATVGNIVFNNPELSGDYYIGSVAGYSEGTIHDITVNSGMFTVADYSAGGVVGEQYTNPLTNLTINNSSIVSAVDDDATYVGGIAGYTDDAALTNLFNNNTSVSGAWYAVGGIVGEMWGGSGNNLHNTGTIGKASVYASSLAGVVGDIYNGATLTNASNSGYIVSDYGDFIGGIAGYTNNSSITQSYNTGDLLSGSVVAGISGGIDQGSITYSYNTGTVLTENGESGGITGKAFQSTINHVYNTGTVRYTGNEASAGGGLGGIVGYTQGGSSITNAYNTGTIDASPGGGSWAGGISSWIDGSSGEVVGNLFNTGYVTGSSDVGAIFGGVGGGIVYASNSYWNTDTSGIGVGVDGASPAQVIGLNTTNMKLSSSYTGWDFTAGAANWDIISATSYPFIRFFYPDTTTLRAISGTTDLAPGFAVNIAYEGDIISRTTSGNDGSIYFLEGNNALSGQTVIANNTPYLIYYADGAGLTNYIINTPPAYASITNLNLANNFFTVVDSVTSSQLVNLVGNLSNDKILFTASGNDITIGNATNPTVNLVIDSGTTFTINGDINTFSPAAGSNLTISGITLLTNDSVINMGTGNITLNNTTNGAQSLTLTSSGNVNINNTIGNTTPLTSFIVNGGGTVNIATTTITTSGNQQYNNMANFTNDTVMTVGVSAEHQFTAGASGPANDITLTGLGSNTYTLNGGAFNLNSITVNGVGGGNTLAADNGGTQTWNINTPDAGAINSMNLAFSNIQNLDGTNNDNTFVFANNASISGTIDAQSLANTNTLDFSAYTTPVEIDLVTVNDGSVDNNGGGTLVNSFLDITHTIGSSAPLSNKINLPLTGKAGQVDVTAAGAGSINDPIFFNGYYIFVGDPAFTNTNALNLPAGATVISSVGGVVTANVGGITMQFINFLANVTTPTGPNIDVAPIINQPEYQLTPEMPYTNPGINMFIGNQIVFNEVSVVPIFDDDQVYSGPICTTFSY